MGILGLATSLGTSLLEKGAQDIEKGAQALGGAVQSDEKSAEEGQLEAKIASGVGGPIGQLFEKQDLSKLESSNNTPSNSGSGTNEGGLAQALQGLGIERAPQNEQNTEHVPGAVGGTEGGL
jgi:hypothetical protein